MASGLTPSLLGAGGATGIVAFLLLRRTLSAPLALLAAALRVAVPVVYFAWYYTGEWTFLDDVSYIEQGRTLLAAGYNPFTVLLHRDGLMPLFGMARGVHILYGWWNHLAQYIFGPHYYSAVFLNIVVSVVAAELLGRLARRAGFGQGYARGLQLFFLLHWDVVAWTSLINLKDILVLTLSLAALLCLVDWVDTARPVRRRVWGMAGAGAAFFCLLWIRFYAPALILAAFGIWVLTQQRGWRKLVILATTGAAVLLLVPTHLIPAGIVHASPVGLVFGAVRFLVTPQPWAIVGAYSFLVLPSIVHWAIFLPSLFGAVLLWRASRVMALLLIYAALVTAFFAAVPELQGTRQRLQIVFVLAWMQYQALYWVAAHLAPRLEPAGEPRAWLARAGGGIA